MKKPCRGVCTGVCLSIWQALGLCIAWLALIHTGRAQTPLPAGQPTQKLIAASINSKSGNIVVGQASYAASNSQGIHLVALDRSTLKLLDGGDKTFTNSADVNQFLKGLRAGADADAILMATGFGNSQIVPGDIAASLQQFGLEQGAKLKIASDFYFLGNGGLDPGQARMGLPTADEPAGGPDGTIRGYFAKNSQEDYSFIQPDYLDYSILPDGTVKVGMLTVPVRPPDTPCSQPDDKGGFHLVAVDALQPAHILSDTNYCGIAGSSAAVTHIVSDLEALSRHEGSYLIFLASHGSAFGGTVAADHTQTVPIADEVRALGGYQETFFYSTGDDHYELVSSPAHFTQFVAPAQAQEGGSVYPGTPTGGLHGVLGRSLLNNYYVPIDADLTGQTNLGLYTILSLPPKLFPHPDNADELAAFQYINNALCGNKDCNVRNAYGNLNQPISDYQTRLASLKDPNHPTSVCPESAAPDTSPFCTMKIQLRTEFSDVVSVRALYANLHDLWLGSGTGGILSLLAAYQDIKNSVGANDGAAAPEVGYGVVELMLSLGSETPVVGKVFGIAEAVMRFAVPLASDANGNPTADIDTTVGKLADKAADTFTDQAIAIGTQFDFFYQDWNRLDSLGKALQSQAPEWTWDSSTTAKLLKAMKPAVEQSYYQSLMPAVYALGIYAPQGGGWPTDPHAYVSQVEVYNDNFKYFQEPFGSNYAPYSYPSDPALYPDPGTQTLWNGREWWGISRRDTPAYNCKPFDCSAQYSPPINTFMAHLFLPVAQGGLGVYRPAFFEGWPLPRIVCAPTIPLKPFTGIGPTGGCDWERAGSGIKAPPPSRAELSVATSSVMRKGDDVTVNLEISNTGSLQADGIDVTRIDGKAMEGSGSISVDYPRLPWQIGALAPGGHTTATVHFDVPQCVTSFAITLRGKLKSDHSDAAQKFRLRQVVPGS